LVIVKLFELASTIVAALHVSSEVLAIAVNGAVGTVKLDVYSAVPFKIRRFEI